MADKDVEIFIKLRDLASKRIKSINKNINKSAMAFRSFGVRASKAIRWVSRELRKIQSFLRRLPVLAKIASGAFVLFMGKKAVESIIEVGAQYERLFKRILIASRGIREDADKTWNKVLEFAAKSPLMTEPVVAAFATLKAAGVEGAFEVTKSLSGLALMFNRQVDDLAGMFLGALQRVFRRMGIIIDRSGKRAVISTSAWTVSVAKDIKSVWKGLAEVIDKSFGDALDTMRGTWAGLVFEFLGKWDIFKNTIAQSGILDTLKATLKIINIEVDKLAKSGKLKKWAKAISDHMINTLEAVIKIVAQFGLLNEAAVRFKIAGETLDPGKLVTRARINIFENDLKRVQERLAEMRGEFEEGFDDKKIGKFRKALDAVGRTTRKVSLVAFVLGLSESIKLAKTMQGLIGQEVLLKEQIKGGNDSIRYRNLLVAKLVTMGVDRVSAEKEANKLVERLRGVRQKMINDGKQTLAQANAIRRQDEIRERADFIHKKAQEDITSLLKQQKSIKDSMLGMSDKEMAKVRWLIQMKKKIMDDPTKFRGAEVLRLASRFKELAGGAGGSKELFDTLFKQYTKKLTDLINETTGAPIGALWIDQAVDVAKKRRETSTQIATAERFEQERLERITRVALEINPVFNNEIQLNIRPGGELLAKEIMSILEGNMELMLIQLNKMTMKEKMSLRSGYVETDATTGAP